MLPEWFKKFPEYYSIIDAIGPYNPDKGYAGPESSALLNLAIPETAYGIELNPAFYQHDGLYKIGGSEHERWLADVAMLTTALRLIEETPDKWFLYGLNWKRRHLARLRIIKYFEAVRVYGNKHFNYKIAA